MVKENQKLLNKVNVLTDSILLLLSIIIAYFIRFILVNEVISVIKLSEYIKFALLLIPIQIILFSFFELYVSFRVNNIKRDIYNILKANTILLSIALSILFIFKIVDISRWLLVIFYVVFTSLVFIKRITLKNSLGNFRQKGYNLKNVIIIGCGNIADDYFNTIKSNKHYGIKCLGYVANKDCDYIEKLGNFYDLKSILEKHRPDDVVCALDLEDTVFLKDVIDVCEQTGTKISIIPFCYKYIPKKPYIDQIESIPLINIRRIPLDNLGNAFIKRTSDILISSILLIITSPIMIITAIIIKLTSKGPVLFKQERVGLNKNIFTMYKFRSMRINDSQQSGWSTNIDPRKTKFGSFIRKFSIDELPQFYNVIIGNMSLVGPRPELPFFVDKFKRDIPLYMVKHQVKPGITGLAQINGYRGDTSISERIKLDIDYIENWDILLDITILIKTALKGFRNKETVTFIIKQDVKGEEF